MLDALLLLTTRLRVLHSIVALPVYRLLKQSFLNVFLVILRVQKGVLVERLRLPTLCVCRAYLKERIMRLLHDLTVLTFLLTFLVGVLKLVCLLIRLRLLLGILKTRCRNIAPNLLVHV